MELKISLTKEPKSKPDVNNLDFGRIFTDHMFVMNYSQEKGWCDARIIPYGPLLLDPSCMFFHYGQTTFEGMKAYKSPEGKILLFRPLDNFNRLNDSNDRLCIPQFDTQFVLDALKKLLVIEKDWIPSNEGTSLYIRPLILGTELSIAAHPSTEFMFLIMLSPVGSYYKEGINPIKIYVEDEYVRAVKGGMGYTKTAGNYAASMKAQVEAAKKGYSQVLWLDGVERKYIEEIGTTNAMFVLDGEVVTPELNGSILPGVTRRSMIELLRSMGYKVTERKITLDELFEADKNGKFDEMFAVGTAAVVSPVGVLGWKDKEIIINNNKTGEVAKKAYDALTAIQYGCAKDSFGWVEKVD